MIRIPITLSTYLARQFLVGIALVFAVLSAIIILFDSIEMIRRAYSKEVPFGIIIEMVLMRFPDKIEEILPFAVLLGGILSFSRLTRTSELIVTRAAGVSAWQFMAPALLVAFGFGIFMITTFNPLSATMLSRFEQLETKYLHGSTSMLSISSNGLWLRQRNEHDSGKTIIHALRMSNRDVQLSDVTFLIFGKDDVFEKRIDAKEAILNNGKWSITSAILTVPGKQAEKFDQYELETNLSIHQIQDSFARPRTMSFWELPSFINTLKEAGFSALRHSLYWNNMLATPLLLVSMVLFSAVFSLRMPRKGRTGLLMAGGILTGFVIKFSSDIISAIGLSGNMPIVMAAWVPVAINLLVASALILHLEDG